MLLIQRLFQKVDSNIILPCTLFRQNSKAAWHLSFVGEVIPECIATRAVKTSKMSDKSKEMLIITLREHVSWSPAYLELELFIYSHSIY